MLDISQKMNALQSTVAYKQVFRFTLLSHFIVTQEIMADKGLAWEKHRYLDEKNITDKTCMKRSHHILLF